VPKPKVEARLIETPWYSRLEAAEYCKLSVRIIDEAASAGDLRKSGTGKGSSRAIYHRDWLDEWLASRVPAVAAFVIGLTLDILPL
jgi:hypothetical protein